MDIEFLSWEIKEPVNSHPFQGALVGGVLGLIFSLLADPGDFVIGRNSILMGYGFGGVVGGLIIGAGLPLFRNRIVAGVVVAFAMSVALLIVHWFWRDSVPPAASVFIGCATGFSYAILFWKYQPDSEDSN